MARVTRRDIPGAQRLTATEGETPTPRSSTTSPPSFRTRADESSAPGAPFDERGSRPAPKYEREEREREQRLMSALDWHRFETWCASNGLRSLPVTPEAIGLLALYITHMAATGRSVATVARALVRGRGRGE